MYEMHFTSTSTADMPTDRTYEVVQLIAENNELTIVVNHKEVLVLTPDEVEVFNRSLGRIRQTMLVDELHQREYIKRVDE
jgi:hypothetical protein